MCAVSKNHGICIMFLCFAVFLESMNLGKAVGEPSGTA